MNGFCHEGHEAHEAKGIFSQGFVSFVPLVAEPNLENRPDD